MSAPRIERLTGAAIVPWLSELAALRIAVFREYPYLYEGSLAYEQEYLRGYAESAQSTVLLARVDEQVVGASTALPLLAHGEQLGPVLQRGGFDPARVYYFGESVLLPPYRRLGLGRVFFEQREAAAREQGFVVAAFCAVVRPPEHPARPADYVPHDAFWQRRGFHMRPDITARFGWRDLGESAESEKIMSFWIKELGS